MTPSRSLFVFLLLLWGLIGMSLLAPFVSGYTTCAGTFGIEAGCWCDDSRFLSTYTDCIIIEANGTILSNNLLTSTYTYLCRSGYSYEILTTQPCNCSAPGPASCKPFLPAPGTSIQSVTAYYDGKLPNIQVVGIGYTDSRNNTGICGQTHSGANQTLFAPPPIVGGALESVTWYVLNSAIVGFLLCWNSQDV